MATASVWKEEEIKDSLPCKEFSEFKVSYPFKKVHTLDVRVRNSGCVFYLMRIFRLLCRKPSNR